jgi:hypothetical protein
LPGNDGIWFDCRLGERASASRELLLHPHNSHCALSALSCRSDRLWTINWFYTARNTRDFVRACARPGAEASPWPVLPLDVFVRGTVIRQLP